MQVDNNSRLSVISETKNIDGKTVIETKRETGFWLPKKTTTITSDGDVFIEHLYANGLKVERQKTNGKFRVIKISHRDVVPSLYEDVSVNPLRRKSHGILLCEETINIYESLPSELKRVCEPGINYLAESAKNAVKTKKSLFSKLKNLLHLK